MELTVVFDSDRDATGLLFVDDGESYESENVTFKFYAVVDGYSVGYGTQRTGMRIECTKTFDDQFDYTSKFRNLNLAKISILNHIAPQPNEVFVNSKLHRVKQRLRFSKHFVIDTNINLLSTNCEDPIVIVWN